MRSNTLFPWCRVLLDRHAESAGNRGAPRHHLDQPEVLSGWSQSLKVSALPTSETPDEVERPHVAATDATNASEYSRTFRPTIRGSSHESPKPLSSRDDAWSSAVNENDTHASVGGPPLSDEFSAILPAPTGQPVKDDAEQTPATAQEEHGSSGQQSKHSARESRARGLQNSKGNAYRTGRHRHRPASTKWPTKERNGFRLSSRRISLDGTTGGRARVLQDVADVEELLQDSATQQPVEADTRRDVPQEVQYATPNVMRLCHNQGTFEKRHPAHRSTWTANAEAEGCAGFSARDRVTIRRDMNWDELLKDGNISEKQYLWLGERVEQNRRGTCGHQASEDNGGGASVSLPSRAPRRYRGSTTGDLQGEWSARRLLDVKRLEDLWSLLQTQNLHRLSGTELTSIVLRLLSLSSVAANAGLGNETGAEVATESNDLYNHSQAFEGQVDKNATDWRNSQRKVPDMAKMIRLREDVKRHPIFKDILSLLPQRVGSLDASSGIALLHALARFGLRPSATLLGRLGDVIVDRALAGVLYPMKFETDKNSRAPEHLTEHHAELTNAELSHLWVSCETLVPLQRARLFQALMQLTMDKFRTATARLESALNREDESRDKLSEESTSHRGQSQPSDQFPELNHINEGRTPGCREGSNKEVPGSTEQTRRAQAGQGGIWKDRPDLGVDVGTIAAVARAAAGMSLGEFHKPFVQVLERLVIALLRLGCQSIGTSAAPQEISESGESDLHFSGCPAHERSRETSSSRRGSLGPPAFDTRGGCGTSAAHSQFSSVLARLVYSVTKLKQEREGQPALGGSEVCTGETDNNRKKMNPGMAPYYEWDAENDSVTYETATRQDGAATVSLAKERKLLSPLRSMLHIGGDDHKVERCLDTDADELLESFTAFFATAADCVRPVHSVLPHLLAAASFLFRGYIKMLGKEVPPETVMLATDNETGCGWMGCKVQQALPPRGVKNNESGTSRLDFGKTRRGMAEGKSRLDQLAENMSRLLSLACRAVDREWDRLDSLPNVVTLLLSFHSLEQSRIRLVAMDRDSRQVGPGARKGGASGDGMQSGASPEGKEGAASRLGYLKRAQRRSDGASVVRRLAARLQLLLSKLENHREINRNIPDIASDTGKVRVRMGMYGISGGSNTSDKHPSENSSLQVKHLPLLENSYTLLRLLIRLNMRGTATLLVKRINSIVGLESEDQDSLESSTERGRSTRCTGSKGRQMEEGVDAAAPRQGQSEHIFEDRWLTRFDARVTRKVRELNLSREFRRRVQWADSVEEVLEAVGAAAAECDSITGTGAHMESGSAVNNETSPTRLPGSHFSENDALCLDSMSLSSALHRLAVLQELHVTDRVRINGPTLTAPRPSSEKKTHRMANDENVEGLKKRASAWWFHDSRMQRLLWTVVVKLPTMDHQITRILWALEKLGFFRSLSGASPLQGLSLLEVSAATAASDDSSGESAARRRASSVDNISDSDYSFSSSPDDTAKATAATDGFAPPTSSIWQQLPSSLFSRLSELAINHELDGTQLSSALRVIASIKAKGFFASCSQALAVRVGTSTSSEVQDTPSSQAERIGAELGFVPSSLRTVEASFQKRIEESEACLKDSFRRLLLHLAPSMSALDASTSLFSLATLGWHSERSGVSFPVKDDAEPGELRRGFKPSADADPVVAAILRRLRMEISNCNSQALTNAVWAVATIASTRQKGFDPWQLKHTLPNELRRDNVFHASDDTPAHFEDDEDRLDGIASSSDSEEFALYVEPVALDPEEQLFLETARRDIICQVHLLGREALSMLLLAAVMLRWQEPHLLLGAVRRAFALLRRAQRPRYMRQNINRCGRHEQNAEAPQRGQASAAAFSGSSSSKPQSVSSDDFLTCDGLRLRGEEDRGEGELHSRVWAILAMLQQQSLDKYRSPSEFPGTRVTERGDTVESATELKRGWYSQKKRESSKIVSDGGRVCSVPQTLTGEGMRGVEQRAYDFLDAAMEAAELLKADLARVLSHIDWPPPKHQWRSKHVQSILLSLMTLKRDRERYSQERGSVVNPEGRWWMPEEKQQCVGGERPFCEQPEASANVTTELGVSTERARGVPEEQQQRQHRFAAACEELVLMLEMFVARSIRTVTSELTGMRTERRNKGFSTSEVPIASEAGETETLDGKQGIVNRWVKRASLLLFALRHLRRTSAGADSLAACCTRNGQHTCESGTKANLTCSTLERSLSGPDPGTEVSADSEQDEKEAAQKRSHQRKLPRSNPESPAPFSDQAQRTRASSDALVAMIELIAVMLRSGFASSSHRQFPSLLLELHSFLVACHHQPLPSQRELAKGSATSDAMLDSMATAGNSTEERSNSGHRGQAADQKARVSTATSAPLRQERFEGSHVSQHIADIQKSGDNVEPFVSARIHAALEHQLRPALISWLVENMHSISDPMYNRLFPLLHLLGAMEELLNTLNGVALQSGAAERADADGTLILDNASASRLNTTVPDKIHVDESTARMPIHEASDVMAAVRRSRAALLSLLLHRRERLTFQPPSLLTSLLKAAFPRRLLAHLLPADLAHGLTALQRLKTSAEARDDAAVASFMATAYAGRTDAEAQSDSRVLEPVSSSPVATPASYGEGAVDCTRPGAGKNLDSTLEDRLLQQSNEHTHTSDWARSIVEDVPVELIAMLNRPTEECYMPATKGNTSKIVDPCEMPPKMDTGHNPDGVIILPRKSSTATNAIGSITHLRGRRLHQFHVGDNCGMSKGLPGSSRVPASAMEYRYGAAYRKTTSQGTANTNRTQWDLLGPQQLAHAGTAAAQLLGVPSAAPVWLRMLERGQPEVAVGDAQAAGGTDAGKSYFNHCGSPPCGATAHPELHSAHRRSETTHNVLPDSSVSSFLAPAAAALTGYLLSLDSPTGHSNMTSKSTPGGLRACAVPETVTTSAVLTKQDTCQSSLLRSSPALGLPQEPRSQRDGCTRPAEEHKTFQQSQIDPSASWTWRRVRALVREKGDRLSAAGALRLLGGGPQGPAVARGLANDARTLANVLHLIQGSHHRVEEVGSNVNGSRQRQVAKVESGVDAKLRERSVQLEATGKQPAVLAPIRLKENGVTVAKESLRLLVSEERSEGTGHIGKQLPIHDEDAAAFRHGSRTATSPGTGDARMAGNESAEAKEEMHHAERLLPLQQLSVSYILELMEQLALLEEQQITSKHHKSLKRAHTSGEWKMTQSLLSSGAADNADEGRDIAVRQSYTKDDAVNIRRSVARLLMTLAIAPTLPLDSAASLVGPVVSMYQKLQRENEAADAGWQRPNDAKMQCGSVASVGPLQMKYQPARVDQLSQDRNDSHQEDRVCCKNPSPPEKRARQCRNLPENVYLGKTCNAHAMYSDTGGHHGSPTVADQLNRDMCLAASCFLHRMLPLAQEWFPRLHGHRGAALLRLLWERNSSEALPRHECTSELAKPKQIKDHNSRTDGGAISSHASCPVGGSCRTADGPVDGSHRANERDSRTTADLTGPGTSQEAAPSEQKQYSEEDHARLGEAAQPYLTRNVAATVEDCRLCDRALVHNLQSAVLRSMDNLSPGALARLWEALSIQAGAASSADRNASSLDSQALRHERILTIPAVGNLVAEKLMALGCAAAYGGWPRCATDEANRPTANGGLHAESHDGHVVPIGYGKGDRSQRSTSETIHEAGHEQSSVETASALPEERDAASDGHWIAGAVAAAGSGLLGSEEQQRIATAAARETHGSAAYFALLSFFANLKNVSLASIAPVVRKLLLNAQRLISREGSLDVRSRLEAEPYKTRLCEPEPRTQAPAKRGDAFAKPGHEGTQPRNNEGSKLKCKDAEHPKDKSSHACAKDSRVQSGMQEKNSRRRMGCCQESMELEDNFSSRADVDGETVICEERRKGKKGRRETDLMAAGWFLWIAAHILQNSGTTGEKYEPQGLVRAQVTPEDDQITHGLNVALQSLLDAVLADLAAYRIQASIEQKRPSSGNSSSKAVGTRSKPGEIYFQLILCLDIVARIRHPLVHPGSSDGFRAGSLTRHPALPNLLDGIAHLINDCASDIEADVAARTTTDGARQSSMEQVCPPPHFLHELERHRRYCSLDSLAYVFHLSRQARVFYPPLVEAVSRAVGAHRRLRCVGCNTAASQQPNGALRSGAGVEDMPSSAFVAPQRVPESIFTASFKQTNGLSPGESSTSLPQSPNRMLRKDDSCHLQKERHWQALLLLADAAIHQPQEALVMLRRELLLFLDDKHTMEALPLQHLIRVLRFALTARDPVQYTATEKTFPAVPGRHAFGYDKAPSSSGRVGLSKEVTPENQPANRVQDGMSHGALRVDGEEKRDVDLKRQERIDSFEENDLSVFENRLDEQHSPKSDFSAVWSTDSNSPESLMPANSTRSHDFGEPSSMRLACHPDDARAEAVYATVAARCVREGALLLKRLQKKREQGRGAFLHLLMELERKGYAPIGLIDTLNKVRLLHLISATRFQRPASFPGSFRASGPEMGFTTMPPKEDGILHRNNQDRSLLTTPPAAAHQWKEIPFAEFGEYGRAGSREGALHQNSSLPRWVRDKAEITRLLLDEGREWPALLCAAVRHYISKGSSRFHMAISATLADDLGIAHENEAWTNEGMSVDITLATEAADGRHAAVEVDGPTHFVEFLRGPALPGDSAGSAAGLDESLRNSCRLFQKVDYHHNAHKTPFSAADHESDPGGEARFTETERKRMKQKAFGPRVEATRCGGTTQYLPTALTQIKHQILRLFGWHVLSVPFFEWQTAQAPEAPGCRPQRQILLLRRKLAAYLPRFAESLQITPASSHARLRRHMQRQNQRRSNDTDEQGSDGGINSVNLGTGSKQSLCGYLSPSSKDSHNQAVFAEETVARERPVTVSGQPAGLFLAPGSKQLQLAIASARDQNKIHDCKNGDTYRTVGAGHHEHTAVGSGGGSNGKDTWREAQHAEHTSTDALPQEWHGKKCRPPPPQKRHIADESNASQKPSNKRHSGARVQCEQNQGPGGRSRGRKRNPSAKGRTGVARALQPDNLGDTESVVGDGTMANFGGGCAGGRDDASPQGADCGGSMGRPRNLSGTRMTKVHQGQRERILRNSTSLLPELFINAESTECKDLPTFGKP
ncbi:UNVERIFIED_CONTAM: RAP domain-containing protein [Hammondia hammondi]|eukprot:XP_008881687.1 RAP domain-containing protein [Hammondia hammondi]